MGGTIFLAYIIQKDKAIFKNKNHSCSAIVGFHMSNQKKGLHFPITVIPEYCLWSAPLGGNSQVIRS